jgi:penicillin-binding protein 1A
VWVAALVVALVPTILWQRCGWRGCPDVSSLHAYQPNGASVLLDRGGSQFATLAPVQRDLVELASLPPHVAAAFIAVEDRRFRAHHGIDFVRVFGAMLANVRARGLVQGSSTITMQLARNVFAERIPASERSWRRKLIEARVALDIERRFSKDEILELYLNHIYFGDGAYGIQTASRYYFGVGAAKLTLEQAAMLAALPKAPATYDPRDHPERAKARRDLVLALMSRQERVAEGEADAASAKPVRTIPARTARSDGPVAAWYVQTVRRMLVDRIGDALYKRRYTVHTTIDVDAQRAAEEELERQIRRVEQGTYGRFTGPRRDAHRAGETPAYLQGAAVVMDPATGDVLALVGGRDIRHSSFNRATDAKRQAGSAFKPFVYATALTEGWSPFNVLDDAPVRYAASRNDVWTPVNFDGQFLGRMTMRDALVQSRNVPAVRLAHEVGERDIARIAHDAGIAGEIRNSPVIALGVTEVSPLELTSAYTMFAGAGTAASPRFITRVLDPEGDVVFTNGIERRDVIDPAIAYIMTDLMRDAVDRGTGRAVRSAGFRAPAAGKTGTTSDATDTWFIGYTPNTIAGVWIGFDRPRAVAPNATGGTVAAYAWGRMMQRIDRRGSDWSMPDNVVRVAIDPMSGIALADGCAPLGDVARTELFLEGTEPDERVCPGGRGFWGWTDGVAGWFRDNVLGNRDREPDPERRVQPRPMPRRAPPSREAPRATRDRFEEQMQRELRARQREAIDAVIEAIEETIDTRRLDPRERRDLSRMLQGVRRSLERGQVPDDEVIGRIVERVLQSRGMRIGVFR